MVLLTEDFFQDCNLSHKIYDILESTQVIARESLDEMEFGKWYLYTALEQSKAFGSNDRLWISEKGNLSTSLAFKIDAQDLKIINLLPLVTAFSLHKLFVELTSIKTTIKWPNDILFNGKKLAGILVQAIGEGKNSNAISVIVGVGVNMRKQTSELILQETTSLEEISPKELDINVNWLAVQFATKLINDIQILLTQGFLYFVDYINDNLELFGRGKIQITDNFDKVQVANALIEKISNDGALIVTNNLNNQYNSIYSGRIRRL